MTLAARCPLKILGLGFGALNLTKHPASRTLPLVDRESVFSWFHRFFELKIAEGAYPKTLRHMNWSTEFDIVVLYTRSNLHSGERCCILSMLSNHRRGKPLKFSGTLSGKKDRRGGI